MPTLWSERFGPYALAALRIVAGLLFLSHGLIKLFGFPAGAAPGLQPLASLLGAGAVIETVGGALIVLGLFTRPTAFLLAGEMAVAYFLFHAKANFFPSLNGGEGAILFCFIFLFLSTSGAGALSLDGLRGRAPRP